MKYIPKNTLAYYQAAPHFRPNDLSKVPVKSLSEATVQYRKDCGTASPEEAALTFYALNHLASIVRGMFTPNEPLPEWAEKVMDAYLAAMVEQGERSTHYIMCIIVREARHTKNLPETTREMIKSECGPEVLSFVESLGVNESTAVNKYMNHPPSTTLARLVRGIELVFNKGKWGGGFGGKPWGNIAHTLLTMVQGKTSLEMMVDTSYTLAHNNGPMFNKGMMYDTQNNHQLWAILDVQRSGQIPELMIDPEDWNVGTKPTHVVELCQLVKQHVPGAFGSWVDWTKVKPVIKHMDYTSHQQKQLKLHPETKVTQFGKFKAESTGQFAVMPGVSVTTYKRVA